VPMSKVINAEEIQRELVRCREKRDQLIDQIHSLEQQIWPLQDESPQDSINWLSSPNVFTSRTPRDTVRPALSIVPFPQISVVHAASLARCVKPRAVRNFVP
jgi:hypothetical protein